MSSYLISFGKYAPNKKGAPLHHTTTPTCCTRNDSISLSKLEARKPQTGKENSL
jgi:hypothetical protein